MSTPPTARRNAPIKDFGLVATKPDIAKASAVVKQFSIDHDIPSITLPSQGPTATDAATAPAIENVAPLKREKPVRKHARAEQAKLSAMVPLYLLEQIDRKRGRTATTRYLILKAFKADGYEVHNVDLVEDGRRGRE